MLKVTILGCGIAAGVPILGDAWGNCDPQNPKNNRKRASILVEKEEAGKITRLLVDASPDLRQQLIDANVTDIDAVLFTHSHADHCHGIDDLGPIARRYRKRIPVYSNLKTINELEEKFGYAFMSQDEKFTSRPIHHVTFFDSYPITGAFEAAGISIEAFSQDHGYSESLGYRIGKFAYSTDVKNMPEEAFNVLKGIEVWVVDCIREAPHPTHSHLEQTLSWIEKVKPKRALLTHMDHTLDYETLKKKLPSHVEPAYDGMVIEI